MGKLQQFKTQGRVVVISTPDINGVELDWSVVSGEFKQEFMKVWNEATESIEAKHNSNHGHNIMAVLDVMVGDLSSYKGMTFEDAYNEATSKLLSSLE